MNSNQMLLTPRQTRFLKAYTSPSSPVFGNCYQAALQAGYSAVTARNLTHLKPKWLSETIGHIAETIQPDQLTQVLTGVVYSNTEPTIIKLKAAELMMKYHGMLKQTTNVNKTVTLSIDLTGSTITS